MSRILLTLTLSFLLIGCSGAPSQPETQNDPSTQAPAVENTQPEPNTVMIEGFKYAPFNLNVKVGTTITWINADSAPHTVTSVGDEKILDSDDLAKGDTFSFTFDTPGTYEYFCAIHPTMKGTVTVSE